MQAPKRLSIKFFAKNPEVVEAEAFVPIFQEWIQRDVIKDELLVDVVDYKHVHHGPGIILIGYESDYAYDFVDGRAGLQYTIKQNESEALEDTLTLALERLFHAKDILQAEANANNLILASNEFQISILDRLNYPQTHETVEALQETLNTHFQNSSNETVSIELTVDSPQQSAILISVRGFNLQTNQEKIQQAV
ncbi:MAG: hypothetical protein Phog2KO_47400 [Phototrophicaceae bacterium]